MIYILRFILIHLVVLLLKSTFIFYNKRIGGVFMIKSIKNSCEHEIVVNKSRFIGIVVYLQSIEDVSSYLEFYKNKYPEATHYCYAYIYDGMMKASDDGEPAKTAGMPILNVLQKQELNHVLAIVVRYFGGIKLGAGGLVRAYSQATSQTLLNANFVIYELKPLYKICFDYTFTKQIDHYIKTMNILLINKEYDEKVTYTCFIDNEQFFDFLQETTSNQYQKQYLRDEYVEKEVLHE